MKWPDCSSYSIRSTRDKLQFSILKMKQQIAWNNFAKRAVIAFNYFHPPPRLSLDFGILQAYGSVVVVRKHPVSARTKLLYQDAQFGKFIFIFGISSLTLNIMTLTVARYILNNSISAKHKWVFLKADKPKVRTEVSFQKQKWPEGVQKCHILFIALTNFWCSANWKTSVLGKTEVSFG